MANAGTVNVDFSAEVAKFNAQLKTVQSSLGRLEGNFKSIEKVAKTALSFFSVGIATNFIRSAANAADALGKTADKLGISTERLTAFELAAQDAGVETATLSKLLTDAQRILGDASFGGPAAKTIKSLGLNISELERLSPDELFLRYADAIGTLKSRSDQFSVAQDLFGKSAQEAWALIDAGRPAIEQAAETVDRLGLALDRVSIRQIENANDKLGLLAKASNAAGQQIAAGLAPFVDALADKFLDAADSGESLRKTVELIASGGYVGLQLVRNAALSVESAFFGVAAAAGKVLEIQTRFSLVGLLNPNLVDSLKASVDENLKKAESALRDIKSVSQIQADLIDILEKSRINAETTVNDALNSTGLGLGGDPQVEAFNASLALKEELELTHYGRLLEIQREYNEASAELTRELDEGEFVRHQRTREAAVIESEQIILEARTNAQNAALGLMQAFAGRSKAVAIALVAINKALAIAQAIQNTGVAVTRALMVDPTGALAARVALLGKIQIALIAATAFAEGSQIVASPGAGAPIGSPTNPVFTNDQNGEQQVGAAIQPATQIFINGLISQDLIDDLVEQLKDRDRRGVVIFSGGGNQANAIRRGT